MRSVAEHLTRCLSAARALPVLDVPLAEALDCVLAEDLVSAVDLPGFDNSSMDGYAVRALDVAPAREGRPVRLPVVADLPAGSGGPLRIAPGTCARIMTGAPLPAGADAVVPVEWTDAGVAEVRIDRAATAGRHVRRAAEDVKAGGTVLLAGTRLSPRHVALAAAVGADRLPVHPRPRVVVLSTGSELVPAGRPLAPGQIYDANGPGLAAAAAELGAHAVHVGIVDDDPRRVLDTINDQVVRADVMITSGGVSAGAFDVVKEVLNRLGTVEFVKVAMQPGMPQGFGTVGPDDVPIFTLPGNPVSAMVSFEVFVRPLIRKLRGESRLHRRTVKARAAEGWRSPAGKRQFVRAVLEAGSEGSPGGQFWVRPVGGGHGSHLVAGLADASCLAVVPEEVTDVVAGDELHCLVLDRAHW